MQDISRSHRFICRLIARHKTRIMLRTALGFANIVTHDRSSQDLDEAVNQIINTYIQLMILGADVFSQDVAVIILWRNFFQRYADDVDIKLLLGVME